MVLKTLPLTHKMKKNVGLDLRTILARLKRICKKKTLRNDMGHKEPLAI